MSILDDDYDEDHVYKKIPQNIKESIYEMRIKKEEGIYDVFTKRDIKELFIKILLPDEDIIQPKIDEIEKILNNNKVRFEFFLRKIKIEQVENELIIEVPIVESENGKVIVDGTKREIKTLYDYFEIMYPILHGKELPTEQPQKISLKATFQGNMNSLQQLGYSLDLASIKSEIKFNVNRLNPYYVKYGVEEAIKEEIRYWQSEINQNKANFDEAKKELLEDLVEEDKKLIEREKKNLIANNPELKILRERETKFRPDQTIKDEHNTNVAAITKYYDSKISSSLADNIGDTGINKKHADEEEKINTKYDKNCF
jgi:hypothetical protein